MAERQLESAEPGDLIEIFRLVGYEHWAVYIGNEEVVHLCDPDNGDGSSSSLNLSSGSARAVVRRQKIQEVTKSDRWRINNFLDDKYKPREKKVIVNEALSRVGEKLFYSVALRNCEHFATELRYGKAESRQVPSVADKVAKVAGTAAVALSVVGLPELGIPVAAVAGIAKTVALTQGFFNSFF